MLPKGLPIRVEDAEKQMLTTDARPESKPAHAADTPLRRDDRPLGGSFLTGQEEIWRAALTSYSAGRTDRTRGTQTRRPRDPRSSRSGTTYTLRRCTARTES